MPAGIMNNQDPPCTDTIFLNSGKIIVGSIVKLHETNISYTSCKNEKLIKSIQNKDVQKVSLNGVREIVVSPEVQEPPPKSEEPQTKLSFKELSNGTKLLIVFGFILGTAITVGIVLTVIVAVFL